ncbi:MAG: DEAD/DEAH box helicase [Candidatus Sericytochromatia bacterium]|nr:DEAD/DEAH box helicase [Candidatus Tanganyikabacteria bacterium]
MNLETPAVTATPVVPTGFISLGISQPLLDALGHMQLVDPTEVQLRAFAPAREGRDLLVQSRTGTGKTLAFLLPLMERLGARDPEVPPPGPLMLVVTPTRELAMQVGRVAVRVARPMDRRVAILTGGTPYGDQFRALRSGAELVVGTPGRLVDHLERGSLDLSGCVAVVLDEADEMLDMGFAEDLEKILTGMPESRQTLLFSATMPDAVEAIARRHLRKPEHLALSSGLEAATTLTHRVIETFPDRRFEVLANLFNIEPPELTMVFCHTKLETETLTRRLVADGFKAAYLNGDLPQAVRTRTLEAFRTRQVPILVATDVAARGIDVRGVTLVVNYDMPGSGETYVHRSGRTGRAGREGVVLNLVTPKDRGRVRRLAGEAGITFETRAVPTGEDVRQRVQDRVMEDLARRCESADFGGLEVFADRLLGNLAPVQLVAALLQDLQEATAILASGYDVPAPPPARTRQVSAETRPPRATRSFRESDEGPSSPKARRPFRTKDEDGPPEAGMVRVSVPRGKAQAVRPGWLVRYICQRSGITSAEIGSIRLYQDHSTIDIKQEVAAQVQAVLGDGPRPGRAPRQDYRDEEGGARPPRKAYREEGGGRPPRPAYREEGGSRPPRPAYREDGSAPPSRRPRDGNRDGGQGWSGPDRPPARKSYGNKPGQGFGRPPRDRG